MNRPLKPYEEFALQLLRWENTVVPERCRVAVLCNQEMPHMCHVIFYFTLTAEEQRIFNDLVKSKEVKDDQAQAVTD